MWPILIASLAALTVVIEQISFLIREKRSRCPETVEKIFSEVEKGKIEEATRIGEGCNDFVAITLIYGLLHRHKAFSNALLQAANKELKRFSRGLPVLDTVITLAPLLGLFGTVTGMIQAFGLLGGRELDAPAVITGGIAAATSTAQEREASVTITVTKSGDIYLNQVKLTLDLLLQRLKQLKAENPDMRVFINGDKEAYFGNAIQILEEVRSSGITKVAIQTKQAEPLQK